MGRGAQRWYVDHMHDYDAVQGRLSAVRNVMLRGRMDAATDMLEKSCVYAVMSIQTQLARHERAFTMHYSGDRSLQTCTGETNYGNQKYRWLSESLATFDFENCVTELRERGPKTALDILQSNFTGLSWTKGAFALAMCGVWELACPDTHTKEAVGYDGRIRAVDDYEIVCEMIDNTLDVDAPLFVKQWALFDRERGEHARHMAFFREVNPHL